MNLRFGAAISPQRENSCAVIITYHPDEGLSDRLRRIVGQVSVIVIIDNASTESIRHRLRDLANEYSAELVFNSCNEGISRALNQGAEWALANGYSWILTLDQDSSVEPDMMECLCQVYRNSPFQSEIAVIGSNYEGRTRDPRESSRCSFGKETSTVISSGSLISLRAFGAIGGFRDDLFIDSVDLEYCLRARSRGFRVMIACKALMSHSIGHASSHRLGWKVTRTSNHSPSRQYFMTRNILIVARQYMLREPKWVLKALSSRVKGILLVCLFEKDRRDKLRLSLIGALDGIQGKTGNRLSESLDSEWS